MIKSRDTNFDQHNKNLRLFFLAAGEKALRYALHLIIAVK